MVASLMPSMVPATQQAWLLPLTEEGPDEISSSSGCQGSGPTVPLGEQWQEALLSEIAAARASVWLVLESRWGSRGSRCAAGQVSPRTPLWG